MMRVMGRQRSPMWQHIGRVYDRALVPVLRAEGFRPRGPWSMQKDGSDGDLELVVRLKPDRPTPLATFYIEWSVSTSSLRGYKSSLWPGKKFPPEEAGIVSTRLTVPRDLPTIREDSVTWLWDPKTTSEGDFVAVLTAVIRSEAVPMWRKVLNRDELARPEWHGYYPFAGSAEAGLVALYVDHADPALVGAWLDQFAASDAGSKSPRLVSYMRARLAGRTDGEIGEPNA